jgi:hypothetical protein
MDTKPALAHKRASSMMAPARATGCKAARSWTRRFLSFQSDQATNHTRVSKPLREGLATAFRVRNHQTTTGSSREGAKSAMPKNCSTRNQVSRLWTQSRSRWSKVSTSCAQRAQTSMSLNPWRRSLSDVQQRPCKTSHPKKRTPQDDHGSYLCHTVVIIGIVGLFSHILHFRNI